MDRRQRTRTFFVARDPPGVGGGTFCVSATPGRPHTATGSRLPLETPLAHPNEVKLTRTLLAHFLVRLRKHDELLIRSVSPHGDPFQVPELHHQRLFLFADIRKHDRGVLSPFAAPPSPPWSREPLFLLCQPCANDRVSDEENEPKTTTKKWQWSRKRKVKPPSEATEIRARFTEPEQAQTIHSPRCAMKKYGVHLEPKCCICFCGIHAGARRSRP